MSNYPLNPFTIDEPSSEQLNPSMVMARALRLQDGSHHPDRPRTPARPRDLRDRDRSRHGHHVARLATLREAGSAVLVPGGTPPTSTLAAASHGRRCLLPGCWCDQRQPGERLRTSRGGDDGDHHRLRGACGGRGLPGLDLRHAAQSKDGPGRHVERTPHDGLHHAAKVRARAPRMGH